MTMPNWLTRKMPFRKAPDMLGDQRFSVEEDGRDPAAPGRQPEATTVAGPADRVRPVFATPANRSTGHEGGAPAGPRCTPITLRCHDCGAEIGGPPERPQPAPSRRPLHGRLLRLAWRLLPPTLFLITHRDTIERYAEHLLRSIGL